MRKNNSADKNRAARVIAEIGRSLGYGVKPKYKCGECYRDFGPPLQEYVVTNIGGKTFRHPSNEQQRLGLCPECQQKKMLDVQRDFHKRLERALSIGLTCHECGQQHTDWWIGPVEPPDGSEAKVLICLRCQTDSDDFFYPSEEGS